MAMTVETQAFHDLIVGANQAHRIFNERGPQAAAYAMSCLREQVDALYGHCVALAQTAQADGAGGKDDA